MFAPHRVAGSASIYTDSQLSRIWGNCLLLPPQPPATRAQSSSNSCKGACISERRCGGRHNIGISNPIPTSEPRSANRRFPPNATPHVLQCPLHVNSRRRSNVSSAETPAIRIGTANGLIRPVAALQDRPCERAVTERKRSSAEGVGCARSGRSRSKLRTRNFVPRRSTAFRRGEPVPKAPGSVTVALFRLRNSGDLAATRSMRRGAADRIASGRIDGQIVI